MIEKDSIESAYCFFHQKWFVYKKSNMEWQRDDIEYAISSYTDGMNPELYSLISSGNNDYLRSHSTFGTDLESAVIKLESMLG